MSVQATSWVWDYSQARGATFTVALAIADAANAQGSESCQSVRTLGRMARCSESSVHRAISELIEAGEIVCIGTNPRYGNTKIYRFCALWNPAWDQPGKGGVTTTPGSQGDTGGVSSGHPGGVTGDTQPQRTPQEEHPTTTGVVDEPTEDDLFAEWWQFYPKKVDRKNAREAFAKAMKRGITWETLRAGLVRYVKALSAEGKVTVTSSHGGHEDKATVQVRLVPGAKGILHPSTWLNKDRWEDQLDDLPAPAPAPAGEDESWKMRRSG